MRQIDRPEDFGELKRVEKPAPEPAPQWRPTGTPGIEQDSEGRLRTSIPENEACNAAPPFPYFGSPQTWGRAIEAIRQGK